MPPASQPPHLQRGLQLFDFRGHAALQYATLALRVAKRRLCLRQRRLQARCALRLGGELRLQCLWAFG